MKKTTFVKIAALLTGTILTSPVLAQSVSDLETQITELRQQVNVLKSRAASDPIKSPIKVKWEPAPSISSPDGLFEMNIRGRLYMDFATINDKNDNENTSATEFRTARLGVEGKAWKDVKYKFEADFAGNEVTVKDAYLQWSGPSQITVGQFKTPNSLEEQTSSRYTTFMERASFTDAFGLARQMGVGIGFGGDNYTVNMGVFKGSNGTRAENEGIAFASRATYGPKMGETQLHLGASVRFQNQGDEQSDIRYRQRPHNHLAANRYVVTNKIANKDQMIGLEAAAVMGAFSLQGEWATLKANLSNPSFGQLDPSFNGGYVEASYMVTGESRAYDPKKGSFQRVKVNNPVFSGGMGTVQLAVRYDRIDLSDKGIFGGEQDTIILGANWWLNRHTRFMVNYSRSKVKNATDVSLNGVDGKNTINTIGVRAQIDW